MLQRGVLGVLARVHMVRMGQVRMMRGLLVIARRVMLRRLVVVVCGLRVVVRRVLVVLSSFL
jgi:hypothetical protein